MINRSLLFAVAFLIFLISGTDGYAQGAVSKLDINAYLELADQDMIYPSQAQLRMLKKLISNSSFQPAPSINNRKYWDVIANSESGLNYLKMAISEMHKAPEVPISDEIYRRANKEGNRNIYKPRYYRTMERIEHFVLAECIENEGRFLDQITIYVKAIMQMKSWLHPNHDDSNNGVQEGRRVTIDLGARRFGSDLALVEVLLRDKLSTEIRTEIASQLQKRITDSYLTSCKVLDENNRWIKTTSNWNSVCTSGSVFSIIAISNDQEERLAAVGSAINSMKFYLSGFGEDGYCSEGAGYWSYGFGHYLYLAQILFDYTEGGIDLFEAGNPEKLKKVGNFPKNYRIQGEICAPFSDGSSKVSNDGGFAYSMSEKHYGLKMPVALKKVKSHDSYSAAYQLILWNSDNSISPTPIDIDEQLPDHNYFDDFGIVISRGKQQSPFSIAIKAGHNAENHNHSDVGSYTLVQDDKIMAGDIGAPSYIAGAFSKDNPARSSWGHPVPRIDNTLQSNGRKFSGKITKTSFNSNVDRVEMDLIAAYEIPYLKTLTRSMINSKTGSGEIKIVDSFSATKPVAFGTAIMTLKDYEILDGHTILIKSKDQTILAKIYGKGGDVNIIDELVPVEHLREGGPAHRIGIDFTEPLKEGSITIVYTPKKVTHDK